jgi:general nucleoside transport system ATP-binding protein
LSASEAVAAPRRPLVELRGVTKRFPGVVANDNISLALHAGEVHVLLGENGAGKSTLIGLLAGVLRPDGGSILIDGAETTIGSPRRALALGIGTVYQHSMLVPTLTVAENLLLGAAWFRRPRRRVAAARLAGDGAVFGIDVDATAVTGRLSLGEQQQVEILRALWRGGRLIVLDEPTAMLTPRGTEQLIAVMRRLAAEGFGVVFITHKLDEALAAGNRVTVLRQGRVAGGLSPADLHGAPREALRARITALMFGTTQARASAAPDRVLREPGGPVLRVRDLTVRAPGRPPLLDHVSFDVAAGEILGIAGVDGNGQRELAEVLAGQIDAEGSIRLDDAEVGTLDVAARHRAGLRYVTDDRLHEGTVGGFSIADNLLLKQIGAPPFWRHGVARRSAIDAHAARLIAAFDVRTPGPRTAIGTLSGGNIQKSLLARELHGTARMVVYSKPTHGLDLRNIAATRARIRDGAAAGIVTLLISTDLEEILELSDRIGVLLGGRLVGIVPNDQGARSRVAALMTSGAAA